MDVNKAELQRRVDECTVFSQCSISLGSRSSTYYLHSSFQMSELRWSVFNKTTEIESRPALYRKKFAPGGFPVNTSEP